MDVWIIPRLLPTRDRLGYAPDYPKALIKLRLEGNKGYLKILHTQSSPN